MSGAAAWMPFYVGDYLGDTQRLTTTQHGAYLLLMLDYWRNGPPPDDDEVLRQIAKLDRADWKKHRPAISRLFQITEGEWRHKRIERELANAITNSERRSSKAKTAAAARWGTPSSNAPSTSQASLVECPPPSPSPRSSPDKESGEAAQRANRLPKSFIVPGDWLLWAISDREWDAQDARAEAESFVDYWTAKSGRDAAKLDWQATWRNWCRNSRRSGRAQSREPVVPL